MSTEAAFLRAIREEPDNDDVRLIYADWLEERGDPLGDFIRDQCALANICFDDPRRPRLMKRALELLTKHGDEWAMRFGLPSRGQRLWQGFLRKVTVPLKAFLDHRLTLRHIAAKQHVLVDFEIDLAAVTIPPEIIELIPESVARENLVLPLAQNADLLLVALTDFDDIETIQKLQFILNRDIRPVLADRQQIIDAINRHYGQTETESVDCVLYEFPDTAIDLGLAENALSIEPCPPENWPAPVVRLVDLIIREAINMRATAIRIDPLFHGGQVYYQIEDKWVERDSLPLRLMAAIVARLKNLAMIKPAIKDGPGAGSFTVSHARKNYDLRVNVRSFARGQLVEIGILPERLL
jgi:uncharacterized protein (TIGR02996 family)